MSVELQEIRDHIGSHPPFDALSEELLDRVVAEVEVGYFRAGTQILALGDEVSSLYYIRSGAVEVFRHNGTLFDRLGEGDIFGQFALLRRHSERYPAKAIEDTLIYFIPAAVFQQLCTEDDHFADFVELSGSRLKATVEEQRKNNDMLITRIRRLVTRQPLLFDIGTTVQEAASAMTDQAVSAILVTESVPAESEESFLGSDGAHLKLAGMLTDGDLRARVLAQGLSATTPLSAIMAEEAVTTIQSDATVYEAMLCMLRQNIHRLPVLHRRRPIGIVHLSDIVRYETNSSLYLVSNIHHQTRVKGLARVMPDVRAAFVRMVDDGASSRMIGSAMATIGRSLIQRLATLAEEELGPAPIPYAILELGSMARDDQTIVTDQDNAMVLDDRYEPDTHGAYFQTLAARVSDGLAECGYPYCKGGIMATNDRWRQPLSSWKEYFRHWIQHPDPESLLHSSIFFDLDCAFGEARLVEPLQDLIAAEAPKSPLFLAALSRNALNRTPPLGFFRTFVLEQDGRHNNSINLKRRGTAPLNDVIRVHALACGSTAQNAFDRLDDIDRARLLPAGVVDKLSYSLEFLSMVRIRHQALALRNEQEPDNNINPEHLDDSERHALKDAFQVIGNAQKFLGFRYHFPSRGRNS